MTVFTGTVVPTADTISPYLLLNQLAEHAVASGWVQVDRYPTSPKGYLKSGAGRPRYNDPKRHWRIRFDRTTSYLAIAELRVWDLEGNEINLSSLPTYVTSVYNSSSSYEGGNAIDGNPSTSWRSGSETTPSFGFTLPEGQEVFIGAIEVTAAGSEPPTAIYADWSDDGILFTSILTSASPKRGDPSTFSQSLDFSVIKTQKIDLRPEAFPANDPSSSVVGVGEILVLRSPSSNADKSVYLGLTPYMMPDLGRYGLQIQALLQYEKGKPLSDQHGVSGGDVYVPLALEEAEYWHFINDRRIITQYRVGAKYTGFYAGYFLPFALPSEYEYPVAVLGASSLPREISWENSAHRNFFDPGLHAGQVRMWSGDYKSASQHRSGSNANLPDAGSGRFIHVWPYSVGSNSFSSFPTGWQGSISGFQTGHWMENVDASFDGQYPTYPALLMDLNRFGLFGALDGVWAMPSNDLVPEQLLEIEGKGFIAFPSLGRRNANNYMLVENK